MAGIASNPSRFNVGSALQRQRQKREEEKQKRLQARTDVSPELKAVVAKEHKKTTKAEPVEEKISHISEIKTAFNDMREVREQIRLEVNEKDKWAKTIDKMGLKDQQKFWLYKTFISKSDRTDKETVVTLGTDAEYLAELQKHQRSYEKEMSQISQRHVVLKFEVFDMKDMICTPNDIFDSIFEQRKENAFLALQNDEKLQMLMNTFGGELKKENVLPC